MSLLNPKAFFDCVHVDLFRGSLNDGQVGGMTEILASWDRACPQADVRFVADSLAQCYHETAQTMQPIEEFGKGRGRAYGVPAGPWRQVYFGRGDIQETWYPNYVHANAYLHALGVLKPDENLAETPDLACRPGVAAAIMIYGMVDGWFTGRKLGDYFSASRNDPVHAREIINGLDCAAQIAVYYEHFLTALNAGGYAGQGRPAPITPLSFDLSDAKGLQGALKALGYRVTVDGEDGPETEAAVKAFQAHEGGLAVDGAAGEKTQAALRKALAAII